MAEFRIETETDTKTGMIYAELYYPGDAEEPLAKTDPIFPNREVAEQKIIEMFEEWMSEMRKSD